MTFLLKFTTEKQCNDCIHYRSKFPGYCIWYATSEPVRCSDERAYTTGPSDECTHEGRNFKRKTQKILGYHQPGIGYRPAQG